MAKESPLLEKEKQIKEPKYSDKEQEYLGALRTKMEQARDSRDKGHDEFDGMSYVINYEKNEEVANTFIAPKKNKEDTNFQSGIIRQKLLALLSSLVNLNLAGDISAFDKDGLEVQQVGDAMEDVILKTNDLDMDEEKKYLRQYELLKHGTVFVEEIWDNKSKVEKKTTKMFDGKLDMKWKTKIKKAFARPVRNIVLGLNVYLGDITTYDISDQPFIFTVDVKPYQEAKRIFGKWDRWKFVPKELVNFEPTESIGRFNPNWRLLESEGEQVEIVRYQDKWNNEFAIVMNGVLMTPVGLPLPWGYEDYNIVQQNLEPINAKFAYGKSMVSKVRNKAALLDEMLRLAVLKTQKSFMPPYLNVSGRILSNRIFMPGKISHGIAPGSLVPISEKEVQGVTNSEFSMIKEITESINNETVSPTFQGQRAEGNPTATEIIELQRQAKLALGLTIFSVSMLEWKLEWLRLNNILVHWFEEEDEVVDKARGILKSKFRKVSVPRNIEGEGQGQRIVIPTKRIPSSEAILKVEDALSQEQGKPVRVIFLNPEEIKSAKLTWQIVVRPRERTTSELGKLLFRAEMADVQAFGPLLKLDYLAERFASVWEENDQKMFKTTEELQQEAAQAAQQVQQIEQGAAAPSPSEQRTPGQGVPQPTPVNV